MDDKANIIITHDNEAGQFRWQVQGMVGIEVLGIMCDVLFDMHDQYVADPLRPVFNEQEARICLETTGDSLAMSFRPETADPLVIKGMLIGAMLGYIQRVRAPDFDPLEVVLGALVFRDTEPQEGGAPNG